MSEEIKKASKFGFRITDIIIDGVSLLPGELKEHPVGKDGFVFETNLTLLPNKAESKIYFAFLIKLFTDYDKVHQLGELRTRVGFFIANPSDFTVKDGFVIMPEPIMATFINIGASTARGIFASYTNGTELKSAILPPFDAVSFARSIMTKPEDIPSKKPQTQKK